MTVLALDIGTSFIKGAVLDLDTMEIGDTLRLPFPEPISGLPALHKEFDPAQILSAVLNVLNTLAERSARCEGLLVCTQMHSLVCVDHSGIAHSTLTTWQDQRVLETHPDGKSHFETLMERLTTAQKQELGNEVRPGLPIGVLFWQAERGELPSPDLFPVSIGDFIMANLCHTEPTTDHTNAHAHGLMDIASRTWHAGALPALGLSALRLPEIVPNNHIVGYFTLGGQPIACYPPVGDYQAALLGALLDENELSINIATGSQVSLLHSTQERGTLQTRPYLDERNVLTVTTIPAGRSLSALIMLLSELAVAQGFALDDPWPYIIAQAEAASDPRLRLDLAFFNSAVGERGALTDIREDELSVGHVFRAAFRNMAENYLACALRLSPTRDWSRLVFSGGLAHRVALLRTLISEQFGAPYRTSPTPEDTLLGLLVLGIYVTGRAENLKEATSRVWAHYSRSIP